MECNNVRKVKKKQVKDELDRIKQAEKKKRRLEKALATSAAIRSELEKKKQRKQEEQKRLDEEGAAIAEAVALHVLLGEDSDDDSGDVMLNKDEGLNKWDLPEMIPHHHHNNVIQGWMVSSSDTTTTGISADLIAAQAVSSLQIGEEDTSIEKYVFNLRW